MQDAADAQTIWLQTRSAVSSVRYPRRIDYIIAVTGLDGDRPAADHYRASCDPSDGVIRLFPISDEELTTTPPAPHGAGAYVSAALSEGRNAPAVLALPMGHPAPASDLLGEPLLSPTYMFGLPYVAEKSRAAPETENALRVIATVSAQAPAYRVELIDAPVLDGIPTYHLELTPLRRPKENRLRELWVGTDDFLPRRAVIGGNFTLAPFVDVPWTVDFSVVDGAPYISREAADAVVYLTHRRVVKDAVIAFEGIDVPGSIYDEPLIAPGRLDDALVEPP